MRESFCGRLDYEQAVRFTADPKIRSQIMASKVKVAKGKTFEFTTSATSFAAKYPWDEWFSGDLLMLERSEGSENDKGTIEVPTVAKDYGVPNDAMLPKIKTAARARYKVCQISRKDADGVRLVNALIIRARDMDAAERAEEDLLRVEEKRAKKLMEAAETVAIAEAKAAGLTDAETASAVKAARKAATNGTAPAATQPA